MASLSFCKFGTLRGPRAADCASIDALRPFSNWVNFKDKYEISITRETLAAFARRVPTKGRSSALSGRERESSQENILAAIGCVFRKWQNRATAADACGAQWCAAFAPGAQT